MMNATLHIDSITQRDQDLGRGTALLLSGAVMVLLKWVLPAVAPLALAAYGIYRLFRKELAEGLIGLMLALAAWALRQPVGWLLWLVGAAMVGFGLFYLVRGLRTPPLAE